MIRGPTNATLPAAGCWLTARPGRVHVEPPPPTTSVLQVAAMTRTSSLVAVLCVLGASRLAAQQIPVPFPLKVLEESVARDSNDASVHYLVALA
jgi:hypothetical protein